MKDFYSMTIREFYNAVKGFEELRKENYNDFLFGIRIASFWAFKGHVGKKLRRPEQLFELEADRQARRDRLKNAKEVVIITHG